MALKPCRECKNDVSDSAASCPHCGVAHPVANSPTNVGRAVMAAVMMAGFGWFFFGGGLQQQAAADMQDLTNQVASDFEQQYRIARQSGSAIDRCVHAGIVAAAYLQAKDDASYARWKATESADCAAAGVPR